MADPVLNREALYAALATLALPLAAGAVDRLDAYAALLVDWNQRINLTSIADPTGIAIRHFADSLTIGLAWQPFPGAGIVDIGAGAGFPGLVLKIAWPEVRVTLIESVGKKAAFLAEAVQRLEMVGVSIVAKRAEDAVEDPKLREGFDLAVARAVAPLPTLAELVLPYVKVGGTAIVYKSGDILAELDRAAHAIDLLGGGPARLTMVPIEELQGHVLVQIGKDRPTPAAYPRRAGVPAKRPLSAR